VTLAVVMLQCGCSAGLQVALLAISAALHEQGLISLATHPLAIGFINVFALGGVVGVGVLVLRGSVAEFLPFRRFNPWLIPPLILTMAGVSVLLSEVDNLIRTVLPAPAWLVEVMAQAFLGGHSLLASVFLLVIIAPLTEELMFRGLVLNAILKRYSAPVAVLFSALLFALIHMNPWQFPAALACGIILGWLFLRTRSLWPCILGHAIMNCGPNLSGILPLEIPGYNTEFGEVIVFQPWWFDLAGASALVIGLVLLWAVLRRPLSGTPGE
jgi:uncharacterized protein